MEKLTKSIRIGDEIPSLTRTALPPPQEGGRNIIHTDDYAKTQGMRGALIGGSTLLSCALQMLYSYFGQSWFRHGKISVSYIGGGAIGGDVLTAHGLVTSTTQEEAGTRLNLDIWIQNQTGAKVLVGQASCIK